MIPDIPDLGPYSVYIWLLVVVGIPAIGWAVRSGLASRRELNELRLRIAQLETRVQQVPDRHELDRLALITGQLAGRIELIAVRDDERHVALSSKIDAVMLEIRGPLHLILQTHLESHHTKRDP